MSPVRKIGKKRFKNRRKAGDPRQSENVTYLRFGDLPPDERSSFAGVVNCTLYELLCVVRGERENGVSVFEARRRSDGSFVVLTPRRGPDRVRMRNLFLNLALANRLLYEVRGTVVGRGASNEPLLRDCELTPIPNSVPVRLCPPKDQLFEGVEWWNRSRGLS